MEILFQGVHHECGEGPSTDRYFRVTAKKEPSRQEVRKDLNIPTSLRAVVSRSTALWEEEKGLELPVWEIVVIPKCAAQMVAAIPTALNRYVKETRRDAIQEARERTHPPFTFQLPTDTIPAVIGLQDGHVVLAVSEVFTTKIWPLVEPVTGGQVARVGRQDQLTLPVGQITIEQKVDHELNTLDLVRVLDPDGNLVLLFHSADYRGDSHIHSSLETLKPVLERLTERFRNIRNELATEAVLAIIGQMPRSLEGQDMDIFGRKRTEESLPC